MEALGTLTHVSSCSEEQPRLEPAPRSRQVAPPHLASPHLASPHLAAPLALLLLTMEASRSFAPRSERQHGPGLVATQSEQCRWSVAKQRWPHGRGSGIRPVAH